MEAGNYFRYSISRRNSGYTRDCIPSKIFDSEIEGLRIHLNIILRVFLDGVFENNVRDENAYFCNSSFQVVVFLLFSSAHGYTIKMRSHYRRVNQAAFSSLFYSYRGKSRSGKKKSEKKKGTYRASSL